MTPRPLVYATRRSALALAQCRAFVASLQAAVARAVDHRAAGGHDGRPHRRPPAGRHRRKRPVREGDRGGAARAAGRLRGPLDQGRARHPAGRAAHRLHSSPRRPARRPGRPASRHPRRAAPGRPRGHLEPAPDGGPQGSPSRPGRRAAPRQRRHPPAQGRRRRVRRHRPGPRRPGPAGPGRTGDRRARAGRLAARRGPGRPGHRVPRRRRGNPAKSWPICTIRRRRPASRPSEGCWSRWGATARRPWGPTPPARATQSTCAPSSPSPTAPAFGGGRSRSRGRTPRVRPGTWGCGWGSRCSGVDRHLGRPPSCPWSPILALWSPPPALRSPPSCPSPHGNGGKDRQPLPFTHSDGGKGRG